MNEWMKCLWMNPSTVVSIKASKIEQSKQNSNINEEVSVFRVREIHVQLQIKLIYLEPVPKVPRPRFPKNNDIRQPKI